MINSNHYHTTFIYNIDSVTKAFLFVFYKTK